MYKLLKNCNWQFSNFYCIQLVQNKKCRFYWLSKCVVQHASFMLLALGEHSYPWFGILPTRIKSFFPKYFEQIFQAQFVLVWCVALWWCCVQSLQANLSQITALIEPWPVHQKILWFSGFSGGLFVCFICFFVLVEFFFVCFVMLGVFG